MKKTFKTYGICWFICFGLFTAISLISAQNTIGLENVTLSFWIGYSFIALTFIGNLVCSYLCLNKNSADKVFLNIPVLMIGFSALAVSLVAGTITMLITAIPYWIGIIVNAAILAFYIIAVISASATANVINSIDNRIKSDSSFIRNLTSDASSLMNMCADIQTRNEVKKVYEALRYSDPMSKAELEETENRIADKLEILSQAVTDNSKDKISYLSAEILVLINKRNIELKKIK